MKKLYEFYGGDENVAQAVRQIPWGEYRKNKGLFS